MDPKSFAADSRDFGKRLNISWKEVSPNQRPLLEAAKVQHECAYQMRKAIKLKYGTIRDYCEDAKQDYQHVGKVLRGSTPIRVEDIGYAVAFLQLSVKFISQLSSISESSLRVAADTGARDEMGAFYTPGFLSEFIVNSVIRDTKCEVLEPSFGDGSFISALLKVGVPSECVTGVELDDAACNLVVKSGMLPSRSVVHSNFMDFSPEKKFDVVVGNPPYVRIRSLDIDSRMKALSVMASCDEVHFGEEASLWLPFTIKSVRHLCHHGCLAFVLPYEITYVKYARELWTYLGNNFKAIEVKRIQTRIFSSILQDVVLLFCIDKGHHTDTVNYDCYETIDALLEGKPSVSSEVDIRTISNGDKAFQASLVPDHVSRILFSGAQVTRCMSEAKFHIGYVCGNKSFFHPDVKTREKWGLPSESMVRTAVSTRRTQRTPLWTSRAVARDFLWLPKGGLSANETDYAHYGVEMGVDKAYKCRRRKPWWRVPSVKTPDLIVSVFSNTPKLIVNDDGWTFSNSLLGGYLSDGVSATDFAETWYTAITLDRKSVV